MNAVSAVVHARSLSTWEADEGQGHLRIHSEFKASLDSEILSQKHTALPHFPLIPMLSIYGAGDGTIRWAGSV